MKYGLDEKKIILIRQVFEKIPEVKKVFIYGSRVKGNYKKTSDIDLSVCFEKGKDGALWKIKSALEDLPIINEISVIDEEQVSDGNFKEEYERTKEVFWERK
jgi:predicted nucleotidyltransferase